MKFEIDEKNWETYKARVLSKEEFPKDQKRFLKKQFLKAHRLMEKMIENENNATLLEISMKTLSQFFSLVYRLTGISATASNFIVVKENDI